ncbi:MAG: phage tail assembly chaperone [Beijerinckiaceae bacterium]
MNAAARQPEPSPFDWDGVMAFGFGVLRLSPKDFWALSLDEIAAAWRSIFGSAHALPTRDAIAALMQQFPDRT